MEKCYSINNLKLKKITNINNHQIYKKSEYITRVKIEQKESEIISKNKKESKYFKIFSNKNINKSGKEILNTKKKVSKIKINSDIIYPLYIKKPPDNKILLRFNTLYQNKFENFFLLILRCIISLINISYIFSNKNHDIFLKLTEITLKVKGTGNIKILSDSFFKKYNQCEIYINDILQNITKNEYYFGEVELTHLEASNKKYNFNNSELNNSNNTKNEHYINTSEINSLELSTNEYYFNNHKEISIDTSNKRFYFTDLENININQSFIKESDSIIFNDEEIENSDLYFYKYSSGDKNDLEKEKDIYEIKIIWNDTFLTTDCMFLNCSKIIDIDFSNFNTTQVNNMSRMFYGCTSLSSLNFSNCDTSNVKTMASMFYGCSSLNILDLSNFDVSQVTTMSQIFYDCSSLISLDLSSFNTSKVQFMDYMFSRCSQLTSLNLWNFNTSQVNNMEYMFNDCSELTSLDISYFDTSKVKKMSYMFYNCSKLYFLNISNFDTSQVTTMNSMFSFCSNLTSLDLSNFNTSQVTTMNSMFYHCLKLTSLELSNFDTSQVKNMAYMFYSCQKLTSLSLSNFNTSQVYTMNRMFAYSLLLVSLNISNFDTSQVNDTSGMFSFCTSFVSLDLSNFDTSQVKNMSSMFYQCSRLISLNLSNFNTSQVINMNYMFNSCSELISLDLSNFDTSNVVDMSYMFSNCKKLNSLNLHNFETSKVNKMNYMFNGCRALAFLDLSNFNATLISDIKGMFSGCENLISLDLSNFKAPQLKDISNLFSGCSKLIYLNMSNFDTSNVQNFSSMFSNCSALYILDISKFNTSQCTDMSYMFSEDKNLSSIDLSNFDTSGVKKMNNMFSKCTKLNSLKLDNFNTKNVYHMGSMFLGCNKISSLNLSNFNTSKVKNMNGMFSGCISLISLDLSNFKTPVVNNIGSMFSGCSNLTSINLSNFNTIKTNNMEYMFNGCLSLKSLDLSNFNIQNVIKMFFMFNDCINLSSLDLSNFRSSKVNNMSHMFYGCSLLISIDLSNFNTPDVNDMSYMFYGCSSLISVGLSNFNQLKVNNLSYMFYNCSELISLNLSNLETSETKNMTNMFYKCSTLTFLNLSNFKTSHVEDMDNMFYGCTNMEYINLKRSEIKLNLNTSNIFSLTFENIMVCIPNENDNFLEILGGKIIFYCDDNHLDKYNCYIKNFTFDNIYICDICQNDFIFKYNESNFNYSYSYINCFEPKIVLCFNSCKACEIEGNETNNNCLECKDEFIYQFNITNSKYKNCYINNPFIPTTSAIKIVYTSEIDTTNKGNRDNNYSPHTSEAINYIVTSTIIQKVNRTEKIQNIISNLISEFTSSNQTDNGKDKKIVDNEKVIVFTSTENQKNNEEDNYITMDLGECENILKNHYHIPLNNSLFILQIISEEKGMKIPKMEYEVYYPLNNTKDLTKLDLTLCEGTKVEISISININGTLDLSLFNPNSEYYNDICAITSSETGTDIPLKDRRNEFVKKNLTLCEENCELVDYNKETKKVKCSCDMKSSINSNYDLNFNKDDFFKSFTDVKNILNLNIMKCYKAALNIKNLKNNYGFFIMLIIIILYFITLTIFSNISYKKLKKEIKTIIWASKCTKTSKNKNKLKNKQNIVLKYVKKKSNKIKFLHKNDKFRNGKNKKKLHIFDKDEDRSGYRIHFQGKSIMDEDNKLIHQILKKNSFELNSLDYKEGRKLDQRSYCEYYGSLLKYNHPLIFSFALYNDYNSKIIKFFLFFFSFCLDFSINALFFTDEAMHKIHQDKGTFDFLYQIPQIIYSVLISRFIDTLIRKLALSQDNIVDLKQARKITKKQKKNLFRILKLKFILYFFLSFIIIMIFFYYITCFCGIYVNTQIHLIKDSLISLATSLLLPFGLYAIPGYFRITALRAKKANHKMLYRFSCLLENLLG